MIARGWLRLGGAMLLGAMLVSAAPSLAATRVVVNDTEISDTEIAQRAKLLQLEGRTSGATAAAQQELIDEALKNQEARRLNITISDAQVDDAIQQLARNLRISTENLRQVLAQAGVSMDTLRARLRTSLAWNAVSEGVISSRVQLSELDLQRQAESRVTAAMSFDYILKEVIFVMPNGQGSASARTSEANRYRNAFQGCDSAVQLSTNYVDAAVLDMGRRHATQLPEPVATELAGLSVGGITRPRVVENGVSMLAVCSKTAAEDLTFITDSLRQEAGNAQMTAEADEYLEELRDKATIITQ